MSPEVAQIPASSFQIILRPAGCPIFQLLYLPESRSRQKILEPPARPYPDCPPRPRWSRVQDRKRGVTKHAQFSAEGQKAAAVRQDPTRLCRSPQLPLVAKTTARNPAARRRLRILAAGSGLATPHRCKLRSAAWSFPDSLRRGAHFHSRQKLFAAELCLRALPETASAAPVRRAAALLRS